uniref:Myb/SANT-like DNA-binding domain-containing protein n=1 Tax=Ursus americanus TaxID=9643 RepID=A0A452Q9R7_URSAM
MLNIEKLQTCQHSQTYRVVAERLWEQGFLRTPEQCRTKFNSLRSRYHKVRAGRVPEPCVLYEEVDAVSGSWVSAPKVASRAVPGQEGRATESGELSQQNGEPTEVGEGVWADGAAGDEEDFWDPGWEGGRLDLPVLFPPRAGRTPDSDSQGTGKSPRAH